MAKFEVDIQVSENGKHSPTYTINSDLQGEQTYQDLRTNLRDLLIEVAQDAFREEVAKGFDKDARVLVDGNPRKHIYTVNPFGRIEYIARTDLGPVLIDIYTAILKRSPVDTGYYYFNNVVYKNNVEIASNKQELITYLKLNPDFDDKDQIRFVNLAPYARKLERHGISSGRRAPKENKRADKRLGKVLKPNGTYVLAARSAVSKYGKNAFIRFAFIDGGRLTGLTGANRTYKTDSGIESRKGQPYFYPSIVVNVIGAAITNTGS